MSDDSFECTLENVRRMMKSLGIEEISLRSISSTDLSSLDSGERTFVRQRGEIKITPQNVEDKNEDDEEEEADEDIQKIRDALSKPHFREPRRAEVRLLFDYFKDELIHDIQEDLIKDRLQNIDVDDEDNKC